MSVQKTKWKAPLLLASSLAVLGGMTYYLEFVRKPKTERAEQSEKQPIPLSDQQVQSINISDGLIEYRFECTEIEKDLCKPGDRSRWNITAPTQLKGDDSNINALLTAIKNLNANDLIDLSTDTPEKQKELLVQYGLNPDTLSKAPLHKVQVTFAGDDTPHIAYFGGTHPIGNRIFVVSAKGDQAQLSTVYLVPSFFKANFDHDLGYWREKRLFEIKNDSIQKLTWIDSHMSVVRVAGAEPTFELQQGSEKLEADPEDVDGVFTTLSILRAKSFPSNKKNSPDAKKALQGMKQALNLQIEASEFTKPVILTLFKGKKAGKDTLYGTTSLSEALFEIDFAQLKKLDKTLSDLRWSKLIASMDRFGVDSIGIRGASLSEPVELRKVDGKWTFEGKKPSEKPFDPAAARKLLEELSGRRILTYHPELKAPKESLTLTLKENEALRAELRFWKSGTKLYGETLAPKGRGPYEVEQRVISALPFDGVTSWFKEPAKESPTEHSNIDSHGHEHGHDHGHSH